MKREEYIKPETEVLLLKSNTPLLLGSTVSSREIPVYIYKDGDEDDEEVKDENEIL